MKERDWVQTAEKVLGFIAEELKRFGSHKEAVCHLLVKITACI